MAGKKKNINNKEQIQSESIGSFPKITSKCKIKSVTLKNKGTDIRFDGFNISEGQAETLSGLIHTGEEIELAISVIQVNLPMKL
jgi:hypothetical protein